MTEQIEKLTQEDGKSLDIEAQNIEQLKQLFPDVFREGKVDFEALKAVLGEYVEDKEERYNFSWHGKNKARQIAQTPSTGTLRPCEEDSVNWDTTNNLYIEGDNLEVLKLLQKSYHKKIKMIYIDPPYNTGRDFVYKDSYQDNLKNYLEQTNQLDEKGSKYSANADTAGRYHSDWLNMMYPRLKLAKNLLNAKGVIFISIDENEISNLRKICDEIFGEDNFLGVAGRVAKKSNNKGDYWAPNFDYILTYAKDKKNAKTFFGGVNYEAYNQIDETGPRAGEKYQLVRLYMSSIQNRNPDQRFFIDCPDGSKIIPPGTTFPPERPNLGDGIWRWTKRKIEAEWDKIVVKPVKSSNLIDESGQPAKWNVYTKTYLQDVIDNASAKPNSLIEDHINQNASHELRKLNIPFDYAKPTSLLKYLIETSRMDKNDLFLDFFSGSASLAHAVMDLNSQDNGERKYICVQIPEPTDEKSEAYKKGYINLCEIGKERIKRSSNSIKENNPKSSFDMGFKVFKLDETNINQWEPSFDNLSDILDNSVDSIKSERTSEDVLYEILLKYGLDLTYPITEHNLAGKTVFDVAFGSLIVCLDDGITREVVEDIGKLKQELDSETTRVVFKDAGFADDSVKVNAIQMLKQYGVDDVKSI